MPKDKRTDEYISNAPPFAQPILKKMRKLIHKACPEVTETIKWGMPSFEYKGPMFGMAAFKQHCVGGFWNASLLNDPDNYLGKIKSKGGEAMGNPGLMTSLLDWPAAPSGYSMKTSPFFFVGEHIMLAVKIFYPYL